MNERRNESMNEIGSQTYMLLALWLLPPKATLSTTMRMNKCMDDNNWRKDCQMHEWITEEMNEWPKQWTRNERMNKIGSQTYMLLALWPLKMNVTISTTMRMNKGMNGNDWRNDWQVHERITKEMNEWPTKWTRSERMSKIGSQTYMLLALWLLHLTRWQLW